MLCQDLDQELASALHVAGTLTWTYAYDHPEIFPSLQGVNRQIYDDLLTNRRSASPGVKYATYEMKVENWNMGTLIHRPATEPG